MRRAGRCNGWSWIGHCRQTALRFGDLCRVTEQQSFGVVIRGLREDLGNCTGFSDLAIFHHENLITKRGDDAEMVGHKDHGRTGLTLKTTQQVEDFDLQRRIERGGGFVREHKVGLQHQRHGDRHALALAARQLMRKHRETLTGVGQANPFQCVQYPRLLFAGAQWFAIEDISHLLANGQTWGQRGHRIL